MVSLVTGASGFIGSHLARHLRDRGHEVVAIARGETDILDEGAVRKLVASRKPDWIFHLAAQSLPRISWEQPARTFEVNVCGTINLFESVRAAGIDPRIVVFCSSSEYAPSERAIPEDAPLAPWSPYAISKMAQDQLARLYHARYKLKIVRVRPFFITGPGKVGDVCSDLARRILAIEGGDEKAIAVGDLEIVRDIVDIRDAINAFLLLAERGEAGQVYNVATGQGYRIGDLVERLRAASGVRFETKADPSLLRPIDERVKIGDAAKLRKLGWVPAHTIDETLSDILDYWRNETPKTS
ncbi:MAG TPA: GDP-mannose 4,6-dehydratase [Kiritimatiellia bacterium]|jgi:GDP-4-dehydro-6-deoxy-D-mannose reductase